MKYVYIYVHIWFLIPSPCKSLLPGDETSEFWRWDLYAYRCFLFLPKLHVFAHRENSNTQIVTTLSCNPSSKYIMIQLYFNSTYHIRFLAMNKVKICGQFDTSIFQRNLFAAKWAAAANLVELEVCEMFEFQWTQFCLKERDNLSVLWDQSTKCVITVDGK